MSTILLIDLSSILHPLWHTTQGSTNPNECSIQTVARVRALASGQPHVAVCCDSGRSFRRDISPDYKANRPERDATLAHQMMLAIETLKGDGFPVWAVAGFEADDLLATAVSMLTTPRMVRLADPDGSTQHRVIPQDDVTIILATSDKDMFQLVSDRVTVHRVSDTKKALQVTPDVVQAEYGIAPNQMRDYLCLVGDASDNIKGAEGIGPKKAAAMLARYGNLEDLYAAIDKGETFLPATLKALQEFRPRLETVRALVTLRTDVPLPFEDVFRERVPADVAVFEGEEPMAETTEDEKALWTPMAKGLDALVQGTLEKVAAAAPIDPMEKLAQEAKAPQIVAPAPASQSVAVVQSGQTQPPTSLPSALQGWQGFEPENMHQAAWLAEQMFKSRFFSAYGSMQAVLSTFLAGKELGLTMMASLRAFHIIEGKPCLSADLIRAITIRSPECELFRCTRRDAEGATFITKRKGQEPIELTFTVAEGRQAFPGDESTWKKSGWGRNPADMCVARASAKLARLVYPDVVHGFYAPEEME